MSELARTSETLKLIISQVNLTLILWQFDQKILNQNINILMKFSGLCRYYQISKIPTEFSKDLLKQKQVGQILDGKKQF